MQTVKKNDSKAIDKIVKTLKTGGLVIYPTETVYGVGVDATNPRAIDKLITYKNRPFGKPFSIAVANKGMAEKYVSLNKTAKNIYKNFLPGPVTVISKGKQKMAPGVESETGTLGIRIPNYKLVIEIINKLGRPITATSANASYKKRPYCVSDVLNNLSNKQKNLIDLIIDTGTLPKREPSTVIDTTLDDPVTLRQGDIKLSKSQEVLSVSEDATKNIAKELWQKYESHHKDRAIVFALEGEMGTGKTQFTKGLALAMGIDNTVSSPTFILENEYQTDKNTLHHFDAWRMENDVDLEELDFGKLIKKHAVISIEWADRVTKTIRKHDEEAVVIWVKIRYGKKENERLINWGVEK